MISMTINDNLEPPHRFIRYGSIILCIQNILLILAFFIFPFLLLGLKRDATLSIGSILILSIDIIGFSFVSMGIYNISKVNKIIRKDSIATLIMVISWICITLISRCSLLLYSLDINRGTYNAYMFFDRLPTGGDRFNYMLNDLLYLYTWVISLILLVLLVFKLGKFCSTMNENFKGRLFNFYSLLNLICFFILIILIFIEPFGVLILEGYFPWTWQINWLFVCFYFLKFLIIPIVGIIIFNRLRKLSFKKDFLESKTSPVNEL